MYIVVTLTTSGILMNSLLLDQHVITRERLTASDSHATYGTVPKQPFTSPIISPICALQAPAVV